MPKGRVKPVVEDVPIWNELIAEIGDPRPYEPGVIEDSYVVPDDAFVDNELEREALLAEHARDVEDAHSAIEGWIEMAYAEFQKIHPESTEATEYRHATETTMQFPVVGAIDQP